MSHTPGDLEIVFKLQESMRAIEQRNDDRIYTVTVAHVVALGTAISFTTQHKPFMNHPWTIPIIVGLISVASCFYVAILTSQLITHFKMQAVALGVLLNEGAIADVNKGFISRAGFPSMKSLVHFNEKDDMKELVGGIEPQPEAIEIKRTVKTYFKDLRRHRGDFHLLGNLFIGSAAVSVMVAAAAWLS